MTLPPEDPGQDRGEERAGLGAVHTPVLLAETLDALALEPGMVVVDGTVGNAGHACAIAERIGTSGRLLGLDRDAEILTHARARLATMRDERGAGVRFSLLHLRFSEIRRALTEEGLASCDRVLLDLGVSSLQLDNKARGFSFMADTQLDMRMDSDEGETAASWLAAVGESELARVLFEYGDERYSRRIARAICATRKQEPITTTSQLREMVVRAMPPRARRGRIHAATRTFQAVRMAVNDEMGELARGLDEALACLEPGGRLV